MHKSKVVGLSSFLTRTEKEIFQYLVDEQTNRLIAYAEKKVAEIADSIKCHGYSMDRTGNLLDSLCWVVSYNGSEAGSGFYRGQTATKDAYVHELFNDDYRGMFPVYGHGLSDLFIKEHKNRSRSGEWVVYFAILAPYWGYWEVGHQNVLTHKYEKFAVMAEVYDAVSKDLKPAEVRFFRSRPPYSKPKMDKMRQHMARSMYHQRRHYKRWPSIENG